MTGKLKFIDTAELASRLKMVEGTLRRRIREINTAKPESIVPDKVQEVGNFKRNLFSTESLPAIRAILKENQPRRGRPWPRKEAA
jgi:hypothetical protein